jgi:subtilisin family serine protease
MLPIKSYLKREYSLPAGNEGDDSLSYPARYDGVISVAAIDSSKAVKGLSQKNDKVALAAPGVHVLSTWPEDRHNTISGTSMACPHVSGVAAPPRPRSATRCCILPSISDPWDTATPTVMNW